MLDLPSGGWGGLQLPPQGPLERSVSLVGLGWQPTCVMAARGATAPGGRGGGADEERRCAACVPPCPSRVARVGAGRLPW